MKRIFEKKNICIEFEDLGKKEVLTGINLKYMLIKSKKGEHSTFEIEYEIKNSNIIFPKEVKKISKNIRIFAREKKSFSNSEDSNYDELNLFEGKVLSIDISNKAIDVMAQKIKGVSNSFFLDRVKKFCSWQDPELTYKTIIDSLCSSMEDTEYQDLSNRQGGTYSSSTLTKSKKFLEESLEYIGLDKLVPEGKTIGTPLLQYYETNWEFLKRIVGSLRADVFPVGENTLIFGLENSRMKSISSSSKRSKIGISMDKNMIKTTKLLSDEFFKLGEEITDLGIILESSFKFDEDGFIGEYICSYNRPIRISRSYNENLRGSSIYGVVKSIHSDEGIAKVGLSFTEGFKRLANMYNLENRSELFTESIVDSYENSFMFPYVTNYSQTNTGFFCTPEVGDLVSVYFPQEYEEASFVMGAVDNPGNGRFSDPLNRNYTIGGFDIRLKDGSTLEVFAENKFSSLAENLTTIDVGGSSLRMDPSSMSQKTNNMSITSKEHTISSDTYATTSAKKVTSSDTITITSTGECNIIATTITKS